MLPGSGVCPGSLFAPQEWGIMGVESESRGTGFPLPRIREDRPRFHEDKLRGNDPPEADRGFGRRLASG